MAQAVQVAPFSLNPLGGGLDEPLLMKPIVADAPGASEPPHVGAVAVAVLPLCETVAFQPWLMVLPLGMVQLAVHGLTAAVPLLRTVTVAW